MMEINSTVAIITFFVCFIGISVYIYFRDVDVQQIKRSEHEAKVQKMKDQQLKSTNFWYRYRGKREGTWVL